MASGNNISCSEIKHGDFSMHKGILLACSLIAVAYVHDRRRWCADLLSLLLLGAVYFV